MRSRRVRNPDSAHTHGGVEISGLSRPGLLGLGGVGLVGIVGAGAVWVGVGVAVDRFALPPRSSPDEAAAATTYRLHTQHQSGIVTPTHDRLHFASFDVDAVSTREDLISLLQDWTYAAARMQSGGAAGPVNNDPDSPPG